MRFKHFKSGVHFIALIVLLFFTPKNLLQAQEKSSVVKGVVTNNTNEPIMGVSVIIKNTKTNFSSGTSTDSSGSFSFSYINTGGPYTFTFSSIGYESQTLQGYNIRDNSILSLVVKMQKESASLDQVVVVGYGSQRKKDLTGTVTHVNTTQMQNQGPSNMQDLLIGNVAGLNVSVDPSAKGSGTMQIRGRSSLNAGTAPLIVLDGVIYNGALSDINPNDIESFDVLKDASSAAVFGAKAANGVIIVNTKKGSSPKPVINVQSSVGQSTMAVSQKPFNAQEFISWRETVMNNIFANHKPFQFSDPRTLPADVTVAQWLAYDGSTGDPVTTWLQRLNFQGVTIPNYLAGKTVNWYDKVFQNGFRQDHNISLSAKKEDISYYMSLEYLDNAGVIVGDRFKTLRGRVNIEGKATKFLTVGMNMQIADRDESQIPADWSKMVNASPYGSEYNDDGTVRYSPDDAATFTSRSPFLDKTYTNRLKKTTTLFAALYAKAILPFGITYNVTYTPSLEYYNYFNAQSAMNPDFALIGGAATRVNSKTFNYQVDNVINWKRSFYKNHRVDITLLANVEKYQSWSNQIDNRGFQPNDNLGYHSIGSGTNAVVSSTDEYSTGGALMARLNYGFKSRYLLTVSVRRDAYSAFGQNNPWATFPAAALGWVFTEEPFMQSLSWLNNGKLRLSYGINGNRDIGRYQAISDLQTGKYIYIAPDGRVIQVSQLYVNRMSNPGLKWERTAAYNAGLDFTILNNRLTGSIDIYKKSTTDLLVLRSLPSVTGFVNVIANLGEVQNKGIELNLNSRNLERKDFSWTSSFNFTLNRNTIAHLYGPVNQLDAQGNITGQVEPDDAANGWFIGHDISEIWDLKILGVWQANEAAEAAKFGLRPGDFKLEDVNKDGKYTDDDRQFQGYRTPRFQASFRNDFTLYKNVDFSFLLYANWGQKTTFNWAKNGSEFLFPDKSNSYKLPYWTPQNPINDYAAPNSSSGGNVYNVYRSTSFIRLQNISIGYHFSREFLQKSHLQGLRLYFNATNAAMYAPSWNFWDPENQGPTPRIFTFGLNVTL